MGIFGAVLSVEYWLGAVTMLVVIAVVNRLKLPVVTDIVKAIIGA